ncbi:MAG: M6 family metalloprotease domain-containing protein [Prevotella sp.]|nr:M6 family metalloprotease domain-containing protein [Prevotella sp.]
MRKFFFILSLLIVTLTISAVPAKPGLWKTITLSNGTEVRAQLVGDEHGHYWQAEDGIAYIQAVDADYYVPVEAKQVLAKAKARRAKVNAQRVQKREFGHPTHYEGQKKAIIILVNFTDKSFKSSNNNALYQKIANQENFNEGDFKGSMADYFKAQSRGKFELDFDVVGPVTVSKNASYYGSNDSGGNDKFAGQMVCEAVTLAKNQVSNWKQYDWDNDGYVDQVYVVYAGKGEADGGAANTIWPHAYSLSDAKNDGDGTGPVEVETGLKVNSYACGPELDGYTGDVAGIGTMCHEFSHCLGYPDFYDTDYSGGQGTCNWDLMDGGSYNGGGYQPAGYTSYERWFAGWETPITLEDEDVEITNMKSLQNGGESYIIYNKGNREEYFLLENRQKEGWDASLAGAGLVILHVDHNESVWESNQPNDDPSHQRMTWIPADKTYKYQVSEGIKYYYTTQGDAFPYGEINSFNKKFGTLAKFYTKNTNGTYYMDGSVEDITQNNDKTISFKYVAKSAEDPGEVLPFYESFDKCNGTGANDGNWANTVANDPKKFVPDHEGWYAEASYGGSKCAKFGASKKSGVAMTPTIALTDQATLTFKAAAWGTDGTTLKLSAEGATVVFSPSEVTMKGSEWKTFTVNMSGAGNARIVFTPAKRFFLDEVHIVNPNPTAIETIQVANPRPADGKIYSIDGRYVGTDFGALKRGIYIMNGKKVVK